MKATNLSLFHKIRPSTLKSNAPAVILLHGYGSDENDLLSFASELPDELFIISVRAPLVLEPYGYAWYGINFDADKGKWSDTEQALQSRDLIANFITEVKQNYPVNTDKMALLGFSQGCILSLSVALTYPEKINFVIGLSGYINTDLIPVTKQHLDYSKLNIYNSHGTDDQVIPIDWARETPILLNELKITHQYFEYPSGHGIIPQNFFAFKSWLTQKLLEN